MAMVYVSEVTCSLGNSASALLPFRPQQKTQQPQLNARYNRHSSNICASYQLSSAVSAFDLFSIHTR